MIEIFSFLILFSSWTSSGKPTIKASVIDFDEVKTDIKILLADSKEFWPADYGYYGPFFIRLAWHTAGTYRVSDGRGGANGARIRFDPERSWGDNTNLNKALLLLNPIKEKFGEALSWGDLIILAGNTAIESMGGPVLGFCGGRVDSSDGWDSTLLGPTKEQRELMPCPRNGACKSPLGASTLGAIYVNAEGPMGVPDPVHMAVNIRDIFGRMLMNDTETVALVGGGHAIGKAHGACPAGAGKSPKEDPANPWPGLCGTGKGSDVFTSGFEFAWSTKPIEWDNEYFVNLLNYEWEKFKGPGGRFQWRVKGDSSPMAPTAHPVDGRTEVKIGRLTSDIAFLYDESYLNIVKIFSNDQEAFNHAFAHAWYKLTTRDMGPVSRCIGYNIPPPQPWQHPLPPSPHTLPNFYLVITDILEIIEFQKDAAGKFARLAWQCISTFRSTDFSGGCNGARIRFSPQKDWRVNNNLDKALELLGPVKEKYGGSLSWADLIVLAGNTAIEKKGGKPMKFCGGRTDAMDGFGTRFLEPSVTGDFVDSIYKVKDYFNLMGLSPSEFAVLNAAGYSIGEKHGCEGIFCKRDFYASVNDEDVLSNKFFRHLVPHQGSLSMYLPFYEPIFTSSFDLMFMDDPEFEAVTKKYVDDNDLFLEDLAAAWTKLSNADRFDGPTGNLCV